MARPGHHQEVEAPITHPICCRCVSPGQLIRATRLRRGVSQERLALRLGTRQSAISRLEADEVSPSFATVERAMRALGEEVALAAGASERRYDPLHRIAAARRTPAERLELALSWNGLAARMAEAGRRARGS